MRLSFSEKQKKLMKKLYIPFDITADLSGDNICDIEDIVGDHLTLHCLDDDYAPNDEGKICYEILDIIGKT